MTSAEKHVARYDDEAALADDVAARLLTRLAAGQQAGRVVTWGMTGGGIADRIHRAVATRVAAGDSRVDWSRVAIYWGDERYVPRTSPDRNAAQARAALLDALPLDEGQVHEMPASDDGYDSVEEAAEAFSREVRRSGAGGFDVLMLGIGPDGHVASLFPGHPATAVTGRMVVGVRESPKPPPERISFTFEGLALSREVWFVAAGEEKADAVTRALADDPSIPAGRVRGLERTFFFLA